MCRRQLQSVQPCGYRRIHKLKRYEFSSVMRI
ncbi:unnamed protein product [Angiostrongylus costaricensis]|uniref:Uncharacterized protein n=1 Tax=Angiostrongylus costaricensis TaxID=334426 RepID=A0A0R3PPW1_ANGCS|nr:unnamed protein product [Angiostrongylus costaricensis]